MKRILNQNRRMIAGMSAVALLVGFVALWLADVSSVRRAGLGFIAVYCMAWALVVILSKMPVGELRKRFVLMTMTIVICLFIVEAPAWFGMIDYRKTFSAPGSPYWWNKPGY